jgi:hypothetical protein
MSVPNKLRFQMPPADVVSGSRKTITLLPTSGSTFEATQDVIFHIPSNGYQDMTNSYLHFDLELSKGTSSAEFVMANGAESVFQRFEMVSSTGKSLEYIDDYNVLQSLLYNTTVPEDWSDTCGNATQGFYKKKWTLSSTATDTISNFLAGSFITKTETHVLGSETGVDETSASFAVKLMSSGMFSMGDQYLPLKWMSGSSYAYALQLHLASNEVVLSSKTGGAITLGTGKYTLKNVRLVYDVISMSDEYDSIIRQDLMQGGALALPYTSWSHIGGSHPASTTQYVTNYTINKRSLNTALLAFRKSAEVHSAQYRSTDWFHNPGYVSHTWQHGTQEYPSSSTFRSLAQVYFETMKGLGRATFYASGTQIDKKDYEANGGKFLIAQNFDQIQNDSASSGLNTVLNPAPLTINLEMASDPAALTVDLFYSYDSLMLISKDKVDVV